MLHYLMYKALSDERTRGVVAAAERHRLVAAATQDSRNRTGWASRLKDVTARTLALFNGRRGVGARSTATSAHGGASTATSASGAGPIGCST